ncbi:MAG TPA: septal ring lytic transglycosylase RlpA family protein [Polyangiales bacterium]|nr:septal ring lytic transglycosylase RlpA family protein [Polyangiales bacterium]
MSVARAQRLAIGLTLAALCGLGCGGSAFQRAQGARFSTIEDPDPAHYAGREPVVVLEGQATYYSDSLAGNHTANGEIYDPARRTAASRDLPFGSVVRVIRRDTGAQVTVRINDRGPFGKRARILDLSRAAAADLRMLGRGVAPVRAEVIVLGDTRPASRRNRARN